MGAVEYRAIQQGTDIAEAYRAAVEQARAEHGNNPYSGTIAASDGFVRINSVPVAEDVARTLADMHLANDRSITRGGPAGAIALLMTGRTLRVDIPETPHGYETIACAAEAGLDGIRRKGEHLVRTTSGKYDIHYRTRRVLSGWVEVELTGGEPVFGGWLFFGIAPY